MKLQEIIKTRRAELNLTYEEIGNICSVTKSTVRKWETSMIENMGRDKIIFLAKALKVSPAYLLGWETETYNTISEESESCDIQTIAVHVDIIQLGVQNITVGERLKELRLRCSYTLEEVGKKLNFSRQTLQRYESGVISNIPSGKIESLSEIYNVSPAYIMGWEDDSKNSDIEINTIAANVDGNLLTDEEQEEVLDFAKYVISKRKKSIVRNF